MTHSQYPLLEPSALRLYPRSAQQTCTHLDLPSPMIAMRRAFLQILESALIATSCSLMILKRFALSAIKKACLGAYRCTFFWVDSVEKGARLGR